MSKNNRDMLVIAACGILLWGSATIVSALPPWDYGYGPDDDPFGHEREKERAASYDARLCHAPIQQAEAVESLTKEVKSLREEMTQIRKLLEKFVNK